MERFKFSPTKNIKSSLGKELMEVRNKLKINSSVEDIPVSSKIKCDSVNLKIKRIRKK